MKRNIKIGLLMLVLSIGFIKTADAVMQCCYARITCGSKSFNLSVCGNDDGERQAEMLEAMFALCG